MRILAISDNHGSRQSNERLTGFIKQSEFDILVCAGDYTEFGRLAEPFYEVLNEAKQPVLFVYGNHEHDSRRCNIDSHVKTATYIGETVKLIGNVAFFSSSGHDIFCRSREWRLSEAFSDLKGWLSNMKYEKSVFVTHEPPTNWIWPGNEGNNAGSVSISSFIDEIQPDLVICGHLHVHEAAETKLPSGTRIINPGPLGTIIEI